MGPLAALSDFNKPSIIIIILPCKPDLFANAPWDQLKAEAGLFESVLFEGVHIVPQCPTKIRDYAALASVMGVLLEGWGKN